MPTFGNVPGEDPLGISLRSRAQAHRGLGPVDDQGHRLGNFGPAPDPSWDGYFQAMGEQGVDNLADNSVGAKRDMWSPHQPLPSTYNPNFQTSALAGLRMAKPQV